MNLLNRFKLILMNGARNSMTMDHVHTLAHLSLDINVSAICGSLFIGCTTKYSAAECNVSFNAAIWQKKGLFNGFAVSDLPSSKLTFKRTHNSALYLPKGMVEDRLTAPRNCPHDTEHSRRS